MRDTGRQKNYDAEGSVWPKFDLSSPGNYGGCSFGFEVIHDTWTQGDDGIDERLLQEVRLHEISIVVFPAYGGTDISTHSAVSLAFESRDRYHAQPSREPGRTGVIESREEARRIRAHYVVSFRRYADRAA
jgi:hypothetical protein